MCNRGNHGRLPGGGTFLVGLVGLSSQAAMAQRWHVVALPQAIQVTSVGSGKASGPPTSCLWHTLLSSPPVKPPNMQTPRCSPEQPWA